MNRWHDDAQNQDHIHHLRSQLADGGRVFVFLGAGLSFGAARLGNRTRFDDERWEHKPSVKKQPPQDDGSDEPVAWDVAWDDDGQPVPSWPWLISRMRERLAWNCAAAEQDLLNKFFRDQSPIDCAQLFRQTVHEQNYRQFLVEQFDCRKHHRHITPTPSHEALVRLELSQLFTTNYDQLIEDAYQNATIPLRVSAEEQEFKEQFADYSSPHLIKLNGTINRPTTTVLTRSDFSKARMIRQEMLRHLRNEMSGASFLFIGFSLSDPNFMLIHDEIQQSLKMSTPVSYTVQGRRDPVKERYLMSLAINTVWLDGWNDLPEFLKRIHPKTVTV